MASMISRALNALGLMRRAEHEEFVQIAGEALGNSERDVKAAQSEIAAYKEGASVLHKEIDRLKIGWNQCGDGTKAMRIARDEAVAMNKKLVTSMAGIETDRNNWREQALRDEQPANMWRNSLKRSRDRKKGVGNG